MASPLLIIIISLLLAGTILGTLAAGGVFKTPPATYIPNRQLESTPNKPHINPQPFKTGYLTNPPQKVADLCNTTLYPIQQPYVDYNSSNESSDGSDGSRSNNISTAIKNYGSCGECDVNIFNSPP
jgi:hypothetical protein